MDGVSQMLLRNATNRLMGCSEFSVAVMGDSMMLMRPDGASASVGADDIEREGMTATREVIEFALNRIRSASVEAEPESDEYD
jgi:hypothetical protein